MKYINTIFISLLLSWFSYAETVNLAWDASPDLSVASYRIHYGTSSAAYTEVTNAGNNLSITIQGLTANETYYFAATAVGTNQLESEFSNEISYTVPIISNTPPTLSFIEDVSIMDGDSASVAIFAQDAETSNLQISAISDNQELIPNENIVVGATNLLITHEPFIVGTAIITVTASDGDLSAIQSFKVTVKSWLNIVKDIHVASSNVVYGTWTNEMTGEVLNSYTNITYHPLTNVIVSWPSYRIAYLQYKTNLLGAPWLNSPTWTNNPAYFDVRNFPMAFFQIVQTNFSTQAETNVLDASEFDVLYSPFILGTGPEGNHIYTTVGEYSNPSINGLATYSFMVYEAGDYVIGVDVWAPDEGSDSFFVDINNDPINTPVDYKVFDTIRSSSPTFDFVNWRGNNGSATSHEFDPVIWNLGVGTNTVYFRGRESNTELYNVYLIKY